MHILLVIINVWQHTYLCMCIESANTIMYEVYAMNICVVLYTDQSKAMLVQSKSFYCPKLIPLISFSFQYSKFLGYEIVNTLTFLLQHNSSP